MRESRPRGGKGWGAGGTVVGRSRMVARGAVGLLALLVPLLGAVPAAAQIPSDTTPHSEGALLAEWRGIVPGRPFTVGLHITLDRGWHTYWVNAGDSGTPALIDWTLPEGFEAGAIQWPTPERVPYPPLMSYAYHDEVLLPVEITPPAGLEPGTTVRLEAQTEWLVCEKVCLVARKPVSLELPVVVAEPAPSPWADDFRAARLAMPVDAPGWETVARAAGDDLYLGVRPPEGRAVPAGSYFFPLDDQLLEHAEPQRVGRGEAGTWIALPRSPYRPELPDTLAGVLSLDVPVDDAGHTSLVVRAPIEEGPAPTIARWARPAEEAANGLTLLVALGFAFLGGLLLNLMPCVFPVLSLKVLGFVEHAGGDRARMRRHGAVFGAGVVLSFLAVAGVLMAIRAAGPEVGWGYQLQSPPVVALLAFLMVAIGLNFLGLFEFGTSLTRLGRVGADQSGYRSSFLTGILAVIVATPCTAPFMGSAIGAALVRPPLEGLAVFAGLGLGMATPYMVLSTWPALLDRLPRPGPWMETLRQALAFPMLAVAAWLLWVLGLQVGVGGATGVLYALLLFAFGGWLLGRAGSAANTTLRRAGRVVAVLALAGSLAWGLLAARSAPPVAAAAAGGELVTWTPYEPGVVEAFQADGRAVFVDFTAAWCITCQVNERVVLAADPVQKAFKVHDVALVRADWTRRDEVIGRALTALGRSGVPVYALYPPEPGAPPRLLPSVLTNAIVLNALEDMTQRTASNR